VIWLRINAVVAKVEFAIPNIVSTGDAKNAFQKIMIALKIRFVVQLQTCAKLNAPSHPSVLRLKLRFVMHSSQNKIRWLKPSMPNLHQAY
jgi:hypothetical protein